MKIRPTRSIDRVQPKLPIHCRYDHSETLYLVMVTQAIVTLNPSQDFNKISLHSLLNIT